MATETTTHTEGPWEATGYNLGGDRADEIAVQAYSGGPVVATVWPMGDDEYGIGQREANAALIAAAPAMLAALEAAYPALISYSISGLMAEQYADEDGYSIPARLVAAAIAQARGL